MTQQSWIAAIIGLIVGVVIGVLVAGKTGTEHTGGRGGDQGIPPSELVTGVESPNWPKVDCAGQGQAIMILDEIYFQVVNDFQTQQCDPMTYSEVCDALYSCALNSPPNPLDQLQHCNKLSAAKAAAMAHDWMQCSKDLDHGH